AILDIRTRRVPNRVWIVMGAIGIILLHLHILLEGSWYHHLIFLPLLTLYSFPFIELEKKANLKKGIITPMMWYLLIVLGFAGIALLLYFGGTGHSTLTLLAIAIFILLVYLMYFSGLIFGGADAKGMMAVTLTAPFYPAFYIFPIFQAETEGIELLFPFPVVILTLSVLVFAFLPLILGAYNLAKRDVSRAMFFGYRMALEDVRKRHVWLMERPKNEDIRLVIFPKKSDSGRLEEDIKALEKLGKEKVWVTPKIPFMVAVFGGYVLSFILGNVLFETMDGLMG
ncbi:MAG: hypothetical protein KAU14_08600, partial [Thermoplasmata archaeon]|nr:hypothetical protein [Thermoplasmata archaeon]